MEERPNSVLRVLIVEDAEDDAILVADELRQAGYELDWERVQTAESMRSALASSCWDLILSDYKMPGFDGIEAFGVYRDLGLDIPFILVSGTIGEEAAVAAMKLGVHDYLLKDRLARLGPAVERELREAESRRERKLAEEALRQSEERYRNLFESMDEGFASCEMIYDEAGRPVDFRYLAVNPAFSKLTGLPAAGVVGRTARELIPAIETFWIETYGRIASNGIHQRIDGRVAGLDKHLELFAWRTGPGRFATVFNDVTDRKRIEEALAASEARFRALLESAPQGVIATDQKGHIALVNARTEEMFGYRRDELFGQPLDVLLPERYRAVHVEHQRQYFAHPRTRAMGLGLDLWGRKKDGSEFPLEISLSCVEQSGTRLALALLTDITERKKAEEHFRQTQKLESIGMLAGGIAHDFNNLLVAVIGNASLAQDTLPPGSPATELLDAIVKTGEQAAHLTRQMLAYAGKGQFVIEPLNLSDLLPEMSGLVQPSISKKIALHLDLHPDLPSIEADRGQMQQVFMNLVLNAAEAIGSNAGMISVRTGLEDVDEGYIRRNLETQLRPGKYVFLEVRDTGCGMDEATRARIFDPFFSTKFQGRGLGLAAVAGIVRGHKGAISVGSAPGKGTCFTVLFPAAEGAAAIAQAATLGATLHGNGTILVVDDELQVRDLAKKVLERYGYKVLLACGGEEAIDIFKRHPGEISLVILDSSMPGMSGEETFPELRKIRPEVKILVSSGYSELDTMRAFPGPRVTGFVQKPYTSRRLAEKVKSAMA